MELRNEFQGDRIEHGPIAGVELPTVDAVQKLPKLVRRHMDIIGRNSPDVDPNRIRPTIDLIPLHQGAVTFAGTVARKNDLHKLDVYRCALDLYRRVGVMVARFPHGEADLRSQMKRASRSVPHNIGEGVGKRGRARAASYEIALGEAKELIVALDCVEIDQLASTDEIVEAQDLADRVSAMLTKLIRSV